MQSTLTTILDDFALFPDWEGRYTYLLDLAKAMPPMPEASKTEANQVRGCTSQVWLTSTWTADNRLDLALDSDALIVRGLLALVHSAYQHATPAEILALDLSALLAHSGLLQNLSPNRRNGFASVVSRIKTLAMHHAA